MTYDFSIIHNLANDRSRRESIPHFTRLSMLEQIVDEIKNKAVTTATNYQSIKLYVSVVCLNTSLIIRAAEMYPVIYLILPTIPILLYKHTYKRANIKNVKLFVGMDGFLFLIHAKTTELIWMKFGKVTFQASDFLIRKNPPFLHDTEIVVYAGKAAGFRLCFNIHCRAKASVSIV